MMQDPLSTDELVATIEQWFNAHRVKQTNAFELAKSVRRLLGTIVTWYVAGAAKRGSENDVVRVLATNLVDDCMLSAATRGKRQVS